MSPFATPSPSPLSPARWENVILLLTLLYLWHNFHQDRNEFPTLLLSFPKQIICLVFPLKAYFCFCFCFVFACLFFFIFFIFKILTEIWSTILLQRNMEPQNCLNIFLKKLLFRSLKISFSLFWGNELIFCLSKNYRVSKKSQLIFEASYLQKCYLSYKIDNILRKSKLINYFGTRFYLMCNFFA